MGNPESAEERAEAGLSPTYRNYLAIIFREQASKVPAHGVVSEPCGVLRGIRSDFRGLFVENPVGKRHDDS